MTDRTLSAAELDELANELRSAVSQMRQVAEDWAALVNIPTLQEGQSNLIALCEKAEATIRSTGDMARRTEAAERENALLKRSLELLTKTLAEKDTL